MTHDFAAQKAATFETYADLSNGNDLADIADVDYFFIATSEGSDWRPLADALSLEGYDCAFIDDDGAPYLVATLPDQAVSAAAIWMGEEMATRIALNHGFEPDGWGFEA